MQLLCYDAVVVKLIRGESSEHVKTSLKKYTLILRNKSIVSCVFRNELKNQYNSKDLNRVYKYIK